MHWRRPEQERDTVKPLDAHGAILVAHFRFTFSVTFAVCERPAPDAVIVIVREPVGVLRVVAIVS
jgi:hypothetical protein